ncbi:peptidoglycan-binding protein [Nostoc sp. CHAB 5844]|nr:peptidoglycan-binding protein [Nostoc sp. CHAB 5844]
MSFKLQALQLPTLQKGSEGLVVTAWQQFLLDNNFPVAAIDGDFGNITYQATRKYQTSNALTATGIVDTNTYKKALEQGFAIYNNAGKRLLAYLNFEDNQVKDLQQSLNAIATLNPKLVVDGDFGPNSTKGLAEAYKKRDVRPVLVSRHTKGLAIDWEITWTGTLNIKNASGTIVSINQPQTSYENPTIWQVGRSYGVIKLTSDRPHWSNDGH